MEDSPSLIELQVTGGIWAFGLLVFTASLKVAVPIFQGDARIGGTVEQRRPSAEELAAPLVPGMGGLTPLTEREQQTLPDGV